MGALRLGTNGAGIAVAVGFVGLLAYGVLARAPDRTIDDALARGDAAPAPSAALTVLEPGEAGRWTPDWGPAAADGKVDLNELRGTLIVLNFWASWCLPCRDEASLLQRRWLIARQQRVLFVGLNMQDATEDARDFVVEFETTFPHLRDPTNRTARRWGVTGIPETFFISRQGKVVDHVIGALSDRQLTDGLAAAQAGKPRAPARGGAQRPVR